MVVTLRNDLGSIRGTTSVILRSKECNKVQYEEKLQHSDVRMIPDA